MAKSSDEGQEREKDRERDKRSTEPRTPGNWMWYLALIAVLCYCHCVSVFVVDSTTKQLLYPDLITLLQNTRYVETRLRSFTRRRRFSRHHRLLDED